MSNKRSSRRSSKVSPLFILFIITAAAAGLTALFFYFLPVLSVKVLGHTANTSLGQIGGEVFKSHEILGKEASKWGAMRAELVLLYILTIVFIAASAYKFFAGENLKRPLSIISAAVFLLFIIVFISLMSNYNNIFAADSVFIDFDKAFKNAGAGLTMSIFFAVIGCLSSIVEIVLSGK